MFARSLRRLEVRMVRFEEELTQAGVDPDDLSPPTSTLDVFTHLLSRVLLFLVLIVPATLGFLVHYPAYRLGGYLATRISKDDDDVVSTVKILSAMLLFPLTCCSRRSPVTSLKGGRWYWLH